MNRYCHPDCAMACRVDDFWPLIFADHVADPATRLAWSLHGLGDKLPPAPTTRHPQLLATVEEHYGIDAVVEGLRMAVRIPPAHDSMVDGPRLQALLDRAEQRQRQLGQEAA